MNFKHVSSNFSLPLWICHVCEDGTQDFGPVSSTMGKGKSSSGHPGALCIVCSTDCADYMFTTSMLACDLTVHGTILKNGLLTFVAGWRFHFQIFRRSQVFFPKTCLLESFWALFFYQPFQNPLLPTCWKRTLYQTHSQHYNCAMNPGLKVSRKQRKHLSIWIFKSANILALKHPHPIH